MFLSVQNIRKSFGKVEILKGVNFDLSQGTTLSILGKSGCGKTTLLKAIGGLLDDFEGQILLHGADITKKPLQQRNVVYLNQEPLLFPHLSVYENIAFGLVLRKTDTHLIKQKTQATLEALELGDQAHKKPHQLSGGQKQRTAFGRAIIIEPQLALLDEPFGALDVETRATMQGVFKRLTAERQITSIFVTHDLKEAILMGDKVGFMSNGLLQTYPSLSHFIADDKTGMQHEIAFWKNINKE